MATAPDAGPAHRVINARGEHPAATRRGGIACTANHSRPNGSSLTANGPRRPRSVLVVARGLDRWRLPVNSRDGDTALLRGKHRGQQRRSVTEFCRELLRARVWPLTSAPRRALASARWLATMGPRFGAELAASAARPAGSPRRRGPDGWSRPSPNEGWTVRDLLTHLTHVRVTALSPTLRRMAAGEGGVPADFDPNRWNAGQLRRRADVSPDAAAAELDAATRRHARACSTRSTTAALDQRGHLSTGDEGSTEDNFRLVAATSAPIPTTSAPRSPGLSPRSG